MLSGDNTDKHSHALNVLQQNVTYTCREKPLSCNMHWAWTYSRGLLQFCYLYCFSDSVLSSFCTRRSELNLHEEWVASIHFCRMRKRLQNVENTINLFLKTRFVWSIVKENYLQSMTYGQIYIYIVATNLEFITSF